MGSRGVRAKTLEILYHLESGNKAEERSGVREGRSEAGTKMFPSKRGNEVLYPIQEVKVPTHCSDRAPELGVSNLGSSPCSVPKRPWKNHACPSFPEVTSELCILYFLCLDFSSIA